MCNLWMYPWEINKDKSRDHTNVQSLNLTTIVEFSILIQSIGSYDTALFELDKSSFEPDLRQGVARNWRPAICCNDVLVSLDNKTFTITSFFIEYANKICISESAYDRWIVQNWLFNWLFLNFFSQFYELAFWQNVGSFKKEIQHFPCFLLFWMLYSHNFVQILFERSLFD